MKKEHQKIRKHFKAIDPIIYSVMHDIDFETWIKKDRPKNGLAYFQHLSREIIGQQLSGKAADAITERFKSLFENGEIDPKKLSNLEDQILRDVGMSWAKARYVKNIAEAYISKSVNFNEIDKLSDQEVLSLLTTIKGVGPWTAEMFLMFTLGREDVFSQGDLGLKKGIIKLYGIDKPTKDQIEAIITKWSPYRSYGSIALWHTLDNR